MLGRQSVLADLPWGQILLRNLQLLAIAVTGKLDHLHTIAQRRWNRSELIRGADEKNLRKIEGQIEIVIGESVVLFRIENFEKRSRRIAAIIRAQLVNLVQHHHRIIHARAANLLNDAARHRAHVSSPMAA